MPTELRPLYDDRNIGPRGVGLNRPGYLATTPHDINNASKIVGYSGAPYGSLLPFARREPIKKATLWDEQGNPTPLEDGPNSSDALCINDAGNILYFVSNDPRNPNPAHYFVGPVGAALALETLIEGKSVGAIDLNDNDVLLGWRENADGSGDNLLYNLTTGDLTILPPLPNGTLIGVDNAGRVLGSVPTPPSSHPQGAPPEILYWLPAGGGEWQATGIIALLARRLSKTGLILATIAVDNPLFPLATDNEAGYLDLNAPSPVFTRLPRLIPPYPNIYDSSALDANASGEIVGFVSTYPGQGPTLYRPSSGATISIESYFTPAGWGYDVALGINDAGAIIGTGLKNIFTPQAQQRGWIINPDRDNRVKDADQRFREFVRILIGVTGGGGGIVLPVGGGPTPIDPEGPRTLLDALSPERKDVITGMLLGHLAGTLHDPEIARELQHVERRLLQKALDSLR